MRIVHVLFTRQLGGLEESYLNTTQALTSQGHEVTALLCHDAPYRDAVASHASAVEYVNPRGFYDIFTVWKTNRLLKKRRPDMIVAHNGRAIALMRMATRRIPIIGVSHSYNTRYTIRADALIVLTQDMKQHFIKAGYPEARIHIIPNLMHLSAITPRCTLHSPLIIGAIGRLSPEKGFADLFHALGKLRQEGLQFILHLAGDGPEKQTLHALAATLNLSEQIVWLGWIRDKAAFYQNIDLLCLPSRLDSFPMVVLETLAYGVPIIASDTPGPKEVLTDGVNGLVVPRGDIAALTNALRRLITDPSLAEQLAKAGLQKIKEYDFPAIARRWDEVLSVIARSETTKQSSFLK